MQESITTIGTVPSTGGRVVLTEALRDGAQRLLAAAIDAEVNEFYEVSLVVHHYKFAMFDIEEFSMLPTW